MEAWENYFEVMEKVVAQVKIRKKIISKKLQKYLLIQLKKEVLFMGLGRVILI